MNESPPFDFARAVARLLPLHWRARLADMRGRGAYQGYPDRYRCIFIHIPKTAGYSVTHGLFNEVTGHSTWQRYYMTNPSKFRRYFKFAFVRNPWDRAVSSFHFLQAGGMIEQDSKWAREHLHGLSFSDFVRNWLNEDNVHTEVHFRPQHAFIADDTGRIMMDFVGRFETLAADFDTVAGRLGLDVTLPKGNSSAHEHYASYYDDETRAIVGRVYAKDIELFGYRFEGMTAANVRIDGIRA